MLNNRIEIFKEELKISKKIARKENANNDVNDKGMAPLRKKEKEIIQEKTKSFGRIKSCMKPQLKLNITKQEEERSKRNSKVDSSSNTGNIIHS